MKVKIAYTMGYHQVPELVKCLLEGCLDKLSELSGTKFNPHELEKLRTAVDLVRQELSLVDSQLQDSLNMMTGYFDAQNQNQEQSLEEVLAEMPRVPDEEG